MNCLGGSTPFPLLTSLLIISFHFKHFFEDQGTIKLVEWGRGCLVLDVLVVFDAQPTFYNGMGYDICRDGRFRSSSNFR
jgi:hypothetical protein